MFIKILSLRRLGFPKPLIFRNQVVCGAACVFLAADCAGSKYTTQLTYTNILWQAGVGAKHPGIAGILHPGNSSRMLRPYQAFSQVMQTTKKYML